MHGNRSRTGAPAPLVPLSAAEALRWSGGEDFDPVKELLDWITGRPPDPGTWPPGPGSAG